MSRKIKKINKTSPNKKRPWPDLPQQLRDIISKQPILLQNISYSGVEKSWSLVSKPCNLLQKPTLPQLHSTNDQKAKKPNIFDIKICRGFAWFYEPCHHRDCKGQNFVGYSHGVLIGREIDPLGCYLWDPFSSYVTLLSRWDSNIPFKHVVLSSLPKSYPIRSVVMVVTGISNPAFVFRYADGLSNSNYVPCTMPKSDKYYHYDKNQPWIKQDCTLIDPHSSTNQYMQFTNAIGFEGKFYALSLQGTLVAIEIIDSCLRIIGVSSNRTVPSVPLLNFKEYLIESNGETLLVFLISTKTTDVVDNIEIYRLFIPTLKWVKIENLKDRALFVGDNCCMHVSARKIGCRDNCVYFTKRASSGWLVFDMAIGEISYDNPVTSFVWEEVIIEEEKNCK